jgi:hypothetical protein
MLRSPEMQLLCKLQGTAHLLAAKDRVIADKDRIIARKNAKLQKSQRIANALRALQADDDDEDDGSMLLDDTSAAGATAAAVSDGGYSSGAASSQPIYAKQGMRSLAVTVSRSLASSLAACHCLTVRSVVHTVHSCARSRLLYAISYRVCLDANRTCSCQLNAGAS